MTTRCRFVWTFVPKKKKSTDFLVSPVVKLVYKDTSGFISSTQEFPSIYRKRLTKI